MQNRKKRVLMVDDDHALTTLVKLRLEEESSPFHVWTENLPLRGALAAKMFRPDVVLLDFNMAQLDGSEVAAQVRNQKGMGEVPIIFYTNLAENGQTGGVNNERFLSKTAEWPEVVACLNEALELAIA